MHWGKCEELRVKRVICARDWSNEILICSSIRFKGSNLCNEFAIQRYN